MIQFYLSLSDVENTGDKLSRILDDVGKWVIYKQLKLNEDKTMLDSGEEQGSQDS